jgi:hypothetical protein
MIGAFFTSAIFYAAFAISSLGAVAPPLLHVVSIRPNDGRTLGGIARRPNSTAVNGAAPLSEAMSAVRRNWK